MKNLYQRGVRIIIIEGGEPFLWRDTKYTIREVVAQAQKLFFSVGVTTNGTFPIEIDSDVVWVSIDGLQKTHDRIRGTSFQRIMDNIRVSSHPRIYAHTTINFLNWKQIPELVDFLSPLVRGITIQFHYPYEGEKDELFLPFSKRRQVLEELIGMKKNGYPIDNSFACLEALKSNRWKCYPWMIASVEPNGRVTQGCYVQNRGKIACQKCGFSAHTELSLAYSGVLESIRVGNRIFGLQERVGNHV
jgi:MoaA/NifB/PqqE/SkfB family radical SAM enzyme